MSRIIGPVLLALLMAACAFRVPAEPGSDDASVAPDPTPVPSAASSRSAAPSASSPPVPIPTATPTPDLAAMDLEAISCPGGVVLHWTASVHPEFHHYIALRSASIEIDPAYPPIAPAVDWGDTYATDRFVTSAVDASILPSATVWHYRVMAYDAAGAVVGATPVRGARIAAPKELASVVVEPVEGGTDARISWGPYRAERDCFSAYRILVGTGGAATSLLGTVSDPARTELVTDALATGVPYSIRVEAVSVTTLGTFVTGATETSTVTLP